jgi:hypothetical protein
MAAPGALLRAGALHWRTKTAGGRPFAPASRHVGAVELVTGLRRHGRTHVTRKRLSIAFYVCR